MTRPAVKRCKECVAEGVTTKRKLATRRNGSLQPGPRCVTHYRGRRTQLRSTSQESRWLSIYGITSEEYFSIKNFQGGVCYLCQRANGSTRALAVDHDHQTGIVRGLLCKTCNRNVLGFARDEIEFFERCIEYLKNPPAVQVIGRRIVPGAERSVE